MKEMKNSGIEWVGEIPSAWEVVRNKYNFLLQKDIVGTDATHCQLLSLTKYGVKTIDPEEQKGKIPTTFATYQTVNKDDIVMCLFDLDVSAVFSGISPYNGMISPAYKCFKCRKHIFPQYVDYYFRTVFVDRKYKRYSKNVRYSIGADEFMSLPIIVPPLDVQKKIADFLDGQCAEIDGLAEEIRAQINDLEQYKKSVITEAVTKGLEPEVPMKDSGVVWIGNVPTAWSVGKCKFISTFLNGFSFDSKDLRVDLNYPVIRIGDIKNGRVDITSCHGVLSNTGLEKYKVQDNDILLAMSGATVGKVGIAHNVGNAYINQRVGIIRTEFPRFLYYCLFTNAFMEYILLKANGSAQPNVSGDVFGEFVIPYPNDNDRQEIVKYLDMKCNEIDAVIGAKREQLEMLAKYKKSLIYEYVTGKKALK